MGHELRVLCPVNLREGDRVLWLVGAASLPRTVLSVFRCVHFVGDSGDPDFLSEADELQILVPKGLGIVGAILVGGDGEAPEKAGGLAVKMQKFNQSTALSKPVEVIAGIAVTGSANVKYDLYVPGNKGRREPLDLSQDGEDSGVGIWSNLSLMHCEMEFSIPLPLGTPSSLSDYQLQLADAINHIRGDLKSSRVVLLAKGSSANSQKQGVVLVQPFNQLKASETVQGINVDLRRESVHHTSLCSDLSLPPSFMLTTSGVQLQRPVEVEVMLQKSATTKGKVTAPIVQYVPATEKAVTLQIVKLRMAVVCMGGSHVALVDAATDLILPALRDQLAAMHAVAAKNTAHKAEVCAYQFCPPGWLHPITAIYDLSHGETELALVEGRTQLHRRLGLPLDRPMLRTANAINFKQNEPNVLPSSGAKRLINVHLGLPTSGVPGGRQNLVDGSYEYYHYLQDRIDDNGWGCAYRSLQTIISWFRLQHYTTLPVPSHKDIQQTLVDIGDKESTFVGSREWIGAIELSFVLDKLLGVPCKILNVRSGADMPSYCRELALHFRTQGTPVMIGGGVLAYTLLGVDYNEATGESSFLILDPHFTGGEDLKAIRSGGWCGWKKPVTQTGQEFFLRNKFYNLLLPQRPHTV